MCAQQPDRRCDHLRTENISISSDKLSEIAHCAYAAMRTGDRLTPPSCYPPVFIQPGGGRSSTPRPGDGAVRTARSIPPIGESQHAAHLPISPEAHGGARAAVSKHQIKFNAGCWKAYLSNPRPRINRTASWPPNGGPSSAAPAAWRSVASISNSPPPLPFPGFQFGIGQHVITYCTSATLGLETLVPPTLLGT